MGSGFDSGFDWGFILPEIQDVLDAIVVLQKAIPAPVGEKDITHAYDEQPESGATFPCFINIVREVGEVKRQSAAPPIPWPACDRDEKDPIVATEKVASGFFAEVLSRPKQSDKTEGGDA